MSAMDQMLTNMLKNLIPAEALEMLSPDKLQEFGTNINNFIAAQTAFQADISARLQIIEDKLDGRNNNPDGTGSGSAKPNAT